MGVTGSSPVGGLSSHNLRIIFYLPGIIDGVILKMAKSKTIELVSLECSSCLEAPRRVHMRNYTTPKNRRNVTEKLELRKYCPRCRKHTAHRESKVK